MFVVTCETEARRQFWRTLRHDYDRGRYCDLVLRCRPDQDRGQPPGPSGKVNGPSGGPSDSDGPSSQLGGLDGPLASDGPVSELGGQSREVHGGPSDSNGPSDVLGEPLGGPVSELDGPSGEVAGQSGGPFDSDGPSGTLGGPSDGARRDTILCHRLVLGPVSKLLQGLLLQQPPGDADDEILLPDFGYGAVRALVDAVYSHLAGDNKDLDKDLDRELIQFLQFSPDCYRMSAASASSHSSQAVLQAQPSFGRETATPADDDDDSAAEHSPPAHSDDEAPLAKRRRVRSSRKKKIQVDAEAESSSFSGRLRKRATLSRSAKKLKSRAVKGSRAAKRSSDGDDSDLVADDDCDPTLIKVEGEVLLGLDDDPVKEEVFSDPEAADAGGKSSDGAGGKSSDGAGGKSSSGAGGKSKSREAKAAVDEDAHCAEIRAGILRPGRRLMAKYFRERKYSYNVPDPKQLPKLKQFKKFRSLIGLARGKVGGGFRDVSARLLALDGPTEQEMQSQFDATASACKALFGFSDADLYACNFVAISHGSHNIGYELMLKRNKLATQFKKLWKGDREEMLKEDSLRAVSRRTEMKEAAGVAGRWADYFDGGDGVDGPSSPPQEGELLLRMDPELAFDDIDLLGTLVWSQQSQCLRFHRVDVTDNTSSKSSEMCVRVLFNVWFGMEPFQSCEYLQRRFADTSDIVVRKQALEQVDSQDKKEDLTKSQCDECGQVFEIFDKTSKHRFYLHKRLHDLDKQQCDCGITFTNPTAKTKHIKLVHSNEQYAQCKHCAVVEKADKIALHIEQNHKEFVCDVCGFKSTSKLYHKEHITRNHRMMKCDVCGEQLEGKLKLKYHKEQAHPKTFTCDQCGAVFSRKIHLYNHKRSKHLAEHEKKYKCDQCPKAFLTKQYLVSHQKSIHIRSFDHECRYGCGKKFILAHNRNLHEKTMHGGKKEK